jgi:DNA repair protein RecO (recombination protein O)
MPLYTTDALILRTYKLGETDRIVVFLTRDRGKKRGVAKGARRSRSRFGAALEPLTRGRVAYFEKERRELVSLNYVEAERSPMQAADGDALGHVGYFAELIDEWAPEGDPNERLFRLGASVVDALVLGVPIGPLARYFEYWLLRLQGVYPSHVACGRCGADFVSQPQPGACLQPGERVFTCWPCARGGSGTGAVRGGPLSLDALRFLDEAAATGPERLGGVPFSARAARELEAVHRALIATHLEKELKSARVLREMQP